MDWKATNLHGAASIDRVSSIYEVRDARVVPRSFYKIKILERKDDFVAVSNVAVKSEGICGLGSTEAEALEDLLSRLDEQFSARNHWNADDFEWSDPHDF